jgi:hypothetical protein
MHLKFCVLVPSDISYEEKKSMIEKLVDPYDVNVKVSEYKTYISKEMQEDIARYFKINIEDKINIAAKIEEWNENRGGVDGEGIFEISTISPKARLDAAVIEEIIPIKKLIEENDIYEQIIIPDGRWIDYENCKKESKLFLSGDVVWEDLFLAILEKYKNTHDVAIVWGDC